MITAKITSKGQITLPKRVRNELGIGPGESIVFEEKEGVFCIRKIVKAFPFDKWAGALKRQMKSTDEVIKDLRGE